MAPSVVQVSHCSPLTKHTRQPLIWLLTTNMFAGKLYFRRTKNINKFRLEKNGGRWRSDLKNVKTLRCSIFNEMFHFRNAKTFCFDIFKMKLNDIFLRNSMDCFVITQVKEKGKESTKA